MSHLVAHPDHPHSPWTCNQRGSRGQRQPGKNERHDTGWAVGEERGWFSCACKNECTASSFLCEYSSAPVTLVTLLNSTVLYSTQVYIQTCKQTHRRSYPCVRAHTFSNKHFRVGAVPTDTRNAQTRKTQMNADINHHIHISLLLRCKNEYI